MGRVHKELEERDQSTISQIGDELDPFIDGNPVLPGERETSLSWWLEEVQRRTYPNLSRFAIHILSIPAMSMSAEPERVFSRCRRTITWQRIWKVVEEGECLKSWIRSGVVAGIRYNGLNSKVV